jgi:hypothetical protein
MRASFDRPGRADNDCYVLQPGALGCGLVGGAALLIVGGCAGRMAW